MKYLWTSNNMTAPSGYGQQTALFLPRIAKARREVVLAANYGVQGAPYMQPDGLLVLPSVVDSALNDIIFGHYMYSHAEAVISLYDPHAYNPDVWRQFPWCAWTPVDSSPLLPSNGNSLKAARWIWAMSRHGEQMLHDAGFNNVTYVPHGIDTLTFSPGNRRECRARLSQNLATDLAGKFLIVSTSANKGMPSRKGFYETLAAFKPFSDTHADAVLYLHTEAFGAFAGEHIPTIMAMLEIPEHKVFFPPQYQLVTGMLPPSYLADAYNAADVYISTSHGEGFGIPAVEAQACGCPALMTDCSAMSELCMAGQRIASTTYMPIPGVTWERPNVPDVITALEWAYTQRGNEALRQEARLKALAYDANIVFDRYMLPALEKIEADLYPKAVPRKITHKRTIAVTEHSNGKVKEPEPLHV